MQFNWNSVSPFCPNQFLKYGNMSFLLEVAVAMLRQCVVVAFVECVV